MRVDQRDNLGTVSQCLGVGDVDADETPRSVRADVEKLGVGRETGDAVWTDGVGRGRTILRCVSCCSFDDPRVLKCYVEEINLALLGKEVMRETG